MKKPLETDSSRQAWVGRLGVKEKQVEVSTERSAEAISILGMGSKRHSQESVSLSNPTSLPFCLSLSPNDVLGQGGGITQGTLGGWPRLPHQIQSLDTVRDHPLLNDHIFQKAVMALVDLQHSLAQGLRGSWDVLRAHPEVRIPVLTQGTGMPQQVPGLMSPSQR